MTNKMQDIFILHPKRNYSTGQNVCVNIKIPRKDWDKQWQKEAF
jgi:hypothetical protein